MEKKEPEEEVGVIYTLGTGSRTLEEFLRLLKEFRVELVCDVRSFPTSRRFPHFRKENLEAGLKEAGFDYVWLGRELGGYRKGGYLAYMATEGFRLGLERLEEVARRSRTAVVCAERFPWRCHRRFISAALQDRGWKVIHVVEVDRTWVPSSVHRGLKEGPRFFD
ncbi:MAG: DUF488 domain-containing protein [Candidatus Geothermincolales bacterium]